MLFNFPKKTMRMLLDTLVILSVLALVVSCSNNNTSTNSKDISENSPEVDSKTEADTPPGSLQEVWAYETYNKITSSPLSYDGSIYFGSDDRKLHSVNAETGQLNWAYEVDSAIRSSPKLSKDSIIFQSNGGTIYSVNAKSGKEQWHVSKKVLRGEQDVWDYYDSSAAIDEDTLYIGSADKNLYALDVATGEERWSFTAAGPIKSTPVYDDSFVYFGDWEGALYALDKNTGIMKWTYQTPPSGQHKAIQSTPVVHDGVLYVGARNFILYALQTSDGKKLWELRAPAWVASPIYNDGMIYVGNSDGNFLQAVDAKTGREKWRYTVESNILSAPLLEDGILYFGTEYPYYDAYRDEYIYAVDAQTGKLNWKVSTDKIQSTPVISNGMLYYTSFDTFLHAIDI